MKTIIAIITASTLCCFSTQAEETPAPAPAPAAPAAPAPATPATPAPKPPGSQLVKELNLNMEQTAKVKEINAAQRDKMKALLENTALSKEERLAKIREIRDANVSSMKEVLSPEQFEKWQKIRQQAAVLQKANPPAKP